jgi:Xaa-Pro aminopeptidase
MGFPGAATLDLYRQATPDVDLRDASTLLVRLAAIKTHHDIAQIHKAAAAAREGMLVAHSAIRVERSEAYVAAVVTDAILRTAHDLSHTGQVQAYAHVMSGARSALAYRAYNLTTTASIAPGKPVLVQLEVCVDGYWAEVTRTFFAGELHSEWAAAHRACLRAQEAALEVIRPGALARDVDRAARHVLAEVGLVDAFKHGLGHGVGFQAINRAAPPILHPASAMVLEPGMVHNLEPAVYLEGNGGLRLNDDVLVGEHHPELLTAMIPRGLDWLVVGA